MATGVSALPPELLRQCLNHVPRNDIAKNTPLVSRAWLAISRDLSWENAQLRLDYDGVRLLAPVLNEGTSIPRRTKAFFIGGSDDDELGETPYRKQLEDWDEEKWQAGFCKVMDHFEAVDDLTIDCLDMRWLTAAQRRGFLRDVSIKKALVVHWLVVGSLNEAAEFLLNQPDISILGIGDVRVSTQHGADETASTPEPEFDQDVTVNLGRVRHLGLFAGVLSRSILWEHIVPLIVKASLAELRTLVVESWDTAALQQLVANAGPALRSLAFSYAYMEGPINPIDLTPATSLTNLSILMDRFPVSKYPVRQNILASTVAAIASAPQSLEHVVLAIGAVFFKPGEQPDDALAHWEALDAALAALPNLKKIVLLTLFPQVYAKFEGSLHSGSIGERMLELKQSMLEGVRERLPRRAAAGGDGIEVRGTFGQWSSDAFAGISLPE